MENAKAETSKLGSGDAGSVVFSVQNRPFGDSKLFLRDGGALGANDGDLMVTGARDDPGPEHLEKRRSSARPGERS